MLTKAEIKSLKAAYRAGKITLKGGSAWSTKDGRQL